MADEKRTITFTMKELDALLLCIGNGYGDGDFNELLSRSKKASLQTGWTKLRDASCEPRAKLTAKADALEGK